MDSPAGRLTLANWKKPKKYFLLMSDYQLTLELLTEWWSTIIQLELLSLVAKKKEAA